MKTLNLNSPYSLIVSIAILMCLSSCKEKESSVYSVDPEVLHEALAKGIVVSGTAEVNPYTEYFGLSYYTYRRWKINLTITDSTEFDISLGNDLYLVESNPEASIFDGIAYCIGQERGNDEGRFNASDQNKILISNPLSTYEAHYTDGGYSKTRGNYIMWSMNDAPPSKKQKSEKDFYDFGKLTEGNGRTIELTLDEGVWLEPEILTSVRIILPEISVDTKSGKERFRLIAFLSRPNADTSLWNVTRKEITHFKSEELAKTLENPEANTITQIFTANWLTEIDSVKAAPLISQLCLPLKQGVMLGTGLDLLTEIKSPMLAEHALKLLNDKACPNGIRSRSAIYLGTVQHKPALSSLIEVINADEEYVSDNAIKGLGLIGGSKAYETLLALIMKKKDSENVYTIAKAMLDTKEPSAVEQLKKLVRENNDDCLEALIDAKKPELYTYFVDLLHDGKHNDWEEKLIKGMRYSDGQKALPEFVDLLSSQSQIDANTSYSSSMVKFIISLNPDPSKEKLAELAHKGNIGAIRVFAGWNNDYAHTILADIAKSDTGTAREVAFNGIAASWPEESRDLLFSMLHSKNPQLVSTAIRGLGNTGDSTLVDSIVQFLDNSNESIINATTNAIDELGPGKQAPAFIKKILTTDNYNMSITLANSLIEHHWKDKSAVKPLAAKLKTIDGELEFPIVRLLRHLSGNAFGPDSYSDWSVKREEWSKKWCEWAEKQPS
jgi:HEAT repeat protein